MNRMPREDVKTADQKKILSDSDVFRLRRKKNKKIWSYFEPISGNLVRCKHCKAMLSCKHTSSNLVRHMYARHQVDSSLQGADKTAYIQTSRNKKFNSTKIEQNKIIDANNDDDIQAAEDSAKDYQKSVLNTDILESEHNSDTQDGCSTEDVLTEMQIDDLSNAHTTASSLFTKTMPINLAADNSNEQSEQSVQIDKLRAETVYYQEMALLARAKRRLIDIQTEKMQRELGINNLAYDFKY